MSSVLKRLAYVPNGTLAARAYCDAVNLARTGLVGIEHIEARLVRTSTLPSSDAREAIQRGFAAAGRKLP